MHVHCGQKQASKQDLSKTPGKSWNVLSRLKYLRNVLEKTDTALRMDLGELMRPFFLYFLAVPKETDQFNSNVSLFHRLGFQGESLEFQQDPKAAQFP